MALFTSNVFIFLKKISSEMLTESIVEPQYGIDGGVTPSGTTNVEFDVKTVSVKLETALSIWLL